MDSRKNEGKRTRKNKRYATDPVYREAVKNRMRSKRLNNPEWYLWDKARRRAIKEGMDFNLSPEDVVIPLRCPVFGHRLKPLSGSPLTSPSLDRVDNTKGYVKGNVAVISHRANTIKGDASYLELVQVCEWLRRKK